MDDLFDIAKEEATKDGNNHQPSDTGIRRDDRYTSTGSIAPAHQEDR